MKAIAEHLKVQIADIKKSIEIHEAAEKKYFGESVSLMQTEPERSEALYKAAESEGDILNEARFQLRCLRRALGAIRDSLHEDYDSFQPEFDIQK